MIPNVSNALNGLMKKYAVITYERSIVNHRVVETPTTKYLMLNKQPMPFEQVVRKPEEQRKWRWYTIWSKSKLEFDIDDKFEIAGIGYRIKGKGNWSEAGYFVYECIEAFTEEQAVTT